MRSDWILYSWIINDITIVIKYFLLFCVFENSNYTFRNNNKYIQLDVDIKEDGFLY